jgi:hypothetical protein
MIQLNTTLKNWLDCLCCSSVKLRPTVSRPVCPGVMRPSGTYDQFFFFFEISFRQLRVCNFVALSLTRGRVCKLLYNCLWALPEQSLLGRSRAELTVIFYCLVWDSPNLEDQVPVFWSHFSAVRNFQSYHWEGWMGSMQCNVVVGYQINIFSGTNKNHERSSWPVAGPSECNWLLASSPALNPRTLTLVPTLCCCIFLLCFFHFSFFFYNNLFWFYNYLYVHMTWISTKPYKTHMEGINAYVNKHAYKGTYICICFSSIIAKLGLL